MTQNENPSVCIVVGGANVDIGGHSSGALVAQDSNPGTIHISLGGVGRNIAHNMCLLGLPVQLLTAYGQDLNGQLLANSCRELGLDISQALHLSQAHTSTYLYIADRQGEMALAVSDMDICSRISPEYLAGNRQALDRARLVVADTNIPPESLQYLADTCRCPLFVDPVSTAKAGKLLPILHRIHTLKPNALEAELLSGVPVETPRDAEQAVQVLLKKGVQRVFLTMGANGVLAADTRQALWLPNFPGKMVSTTGCGDSFMAALAWAWTEGLDLAASARAGLAASSITLESAQTIHPGLNPQAIRSRSGLS